MEGLAKPVVGALVAYLVGGIPFGLWICRWWSGYDPRQYGSGNIGATNVYRLLGPKGFIVVLLLDAAKGFGAVHAGAGVCGVRTPWLMVLFGVCAICGANWSVYLRFKGGKGVGVSLGVGLAVMWKVALSALVVWIVVVVITRYVSLSSIAAGVSVPLFAVAFREHTAIKAFGCVLALLIVIRHRENIKRLISGTEPKFGARIAVQKQAEAEKG